MIIGVADLNEMLETLSEVSQRGLINGVVEATQFVQQDAKSRCPAHDGELRQSIYTDTETQGEAITGSCYTSKSYASYVEFGTGPKGQQHHEGISPDVAVAYTQSPWWIHESQIDKEVAEKYHFFSIKTKDGIFYQCTGQPARPFMYPALKDNEDEVVRIIERNIREQL